MQKQFDQRETFDESDAFEAPWLATADVGELIHFEVDRSRTYVEVIDNPFPTKAKTINQGRAEMRNIRYVVEGNEPGEYEDKKNGSVEIDGEHVVPFWAGAPLKKCFKRTKAKKWIAMAYYRETHEEDREDGSVTINTANFAIL